jgi:DNA-binding PadR family transcriptional regulator
MDLRSTILAILSWKPLSGYDLKGIICDSEIYHWSGNNNQIYKSLIELQNGGLVSHQVQLQEGKPAKKVYALTAAGLEQFKRSLLAEPELPEVRKGFLIQLAWSGSLSDSELLSLLDKYMDELSIRIRMLKFQADTMTAHPKRSRREAYLWTRIHENIVLACQAEMDWANQTKQEIREHKFLELEVNEGEE